MSIQNCFISTNKMKYFSVTHRMKNFGHCSFNKTNNFNPPNLAPGAFSKNAISRINEKVYGFNISNIRAKSDLL